MIADPLDELLADLIGTAALPRPAPTPANAANPAKRQHSCGLAADLYRCEVLRKPANPGADDDPADRDSQKFATLRKPTNSLQGQQIHGPSQNSQVSQPGPPSTLARTCTGCAHRLRRGTCGQPARAELDPPPGLAPGAAWFGIRWPPAGHGAICPAFKVNQRETT